MQFMKNGEKFKLHPSHFFSNVIYTFTLTNHIADCRYKLSGVSIISFNWNPKSKDNFIQFSFISNWRKMKESKRKLECTNNVR